MYPAGGAIRNLVGKHFTNSSGDRGIAARMPRAEASREPQRNHFLFLIVAPE